MQLRRSLGTGAALLLLSLGGNALAQASVAIEPYMPPPAQPIQPGQPMQPGQPGQPGYPAQPGQPGYPAQPGQPVYVYPPGSQPPPVYYQPPPPPQRQIVNYRMQPRIGLIVGGSVMLGSMWLITAIAGGVSTTLCDAVSSSGCNQVYWPLFVPVVGPFIQMGYIAPGDPARGLALVGLAFDGLVQVGGLTMLILGATLRQRVPVYASKSWQIAPTFTAGGSGLAFSTRF